MVSWQSWHYCGCDDPTTQAGAGSPTQAIVLDPAKPPRGANLKHAKLRVLARPYPQVVAGTPLSLRLRPRQRAASSSSTRGSARPAREASAAD